MVGSIVILYRRDASNLYIDDSHRDHVRQLEQDRLLPNGLEMKDEGKIRILPRWFVKAS